MKDIRKNEFIDLLDLNELIYQKKNDYSITVDVPELGEITYFPKSNRVQVHKDNSYIDSAFYFVRNHLKQLKNENKIQK